MTIQVNHNSVWRAAAPNVRYMGHWYEPRVVYMHRNGVWRPVAYALESVLITPSATTVPRGTTVTLAAAAMNNILGWGWDGAGYGPLGYEWWISSGGFANLSGEVSPTASATATTPGVRQFECRITDTLTGTQAQANIQVTWT